MSITQDSFQSPNQTRLRSLCYSRAFSCCFWRSLSTMATSFLFVFPCHPVHNLIRWRVRALSYMHFIVSLRIQIPRHATKGQGTTREKAIGGENGTQWAGNTDDAQLANRTVLTDNEFELRIYACLTKFSCHATIR